MIGSAAASAELKKLAAFGVVGFASFCVYLALVAASVEAGLGQVAGALLGFIGGTFVSFFGNCRFVFRASPTTVIGGRFLATTIAGFGVNLALAWTLTTMGFHYALMTLVIFLVVPGFNYIGHRLWTFADRS